MFAQRSVPASRPYLALVGLAAAIAAAPVAAQRTLTVPDQYSTIQAAIDAAVRGDTVVVADGVYRGTGNKDLTFRGKDIIVRSANGAPSCIIDCEGSTADPFRGFLFEEGETRDAVVEGFTITNGATLPGAISDPFNGGAIRVRRESSPTIRDCVFEGNSAGCWGGGVYVGFGGSPLITGCVFKSNTADDGGGFFSWMGARTTIEDSLFVGNSVNTTGGAIAGFGGGGGLDIDGCTIVGNTAPFGVGGLVEFGNESTVTHSILWGNSAGAQVATSGAAVDYCAIEGGHPGLGNIDADPSFVDAQQGDYRLAAGSPCVDAGDPAGPFGGVDLAGMPRHLDGDLDGAIVRDMGAHEFGHVHLDAPPAARRGAVLTLDTTGTSTLMSVLLVGTRPGEQMLPPFGALLLDLGAPWAVLDIGVVPAQRHVPIPGLPVGLRLSFQDLVFASSSIGNTSNRVDVVIE
ncbi:MAG: right-handed parallel beta-helix repeat-containing protein [Planctomycetota bacterium]